MQRLRTRIPFDAHFHGRDGAILAATMPLVARNFFGAVMMPNLTPPLTTRDMAHAYHGRIANELKRIPGGRRFHIIVPLYLSDDTSPDEFRMGDQVVTCGKFYPKHEKHGTTNSSAGVSDVRKIYKVLERMQRIGAALLLHGEKLVQDNGDPISPHWRVKEFVFKVLLPLRRDFPKLKICIEHITSALEYNIIMADPSGRTAGSITAHHLEYTASSLFEGGLQPHRHYMPVAKEPSDREVLRKAATSGDRRFFLGTDSAPHDEAAKVSPCGCASGIFNVRDALPMYLRAFEAEGALGNFEAFASLNGPAFHSIPPSDEFVEFERVDEGYEPDTSPLITEDGKSLRCYTTAPPFFDAERLHWRLV